MGLSSGRLPSVMNHNFSTVPKAEIQRSVFNRSSSFKTTMGETFQVDESKLYPIFIDEALPGDTFNMKATTFARLATPMVPLMDNLYCDVHFFAVPNRLVWDNWQHFMGEKTNPTDSTTYVVPMLTTPAVTGVTTGSIYDYFGIPVGVPGLQFSALPLRAYALIWQEWYRDQNLQNSPTFYKTDGGGGENTTTYHLLARGKRHDYFTSCLPWAQKGTAVSIPLGTTAPVTRVDNAPYWNVYNGTTNTFASATPTVQVNSAHNLVNSTATVGYSLDPNGGLVTDLTAATAATINSLRQAFQIQKLYERDARGGTRYVELIRSHFGVVSPDFRLQRPEYLGGGSAQINVTPIAQTSSTDSTSPQGNLSAIGTMSHSGIGFTKSFTEHCIIIGLASFRADLTYQQGLERMWSRSTRWDFYWPALSHIGEQAVLNKEIYAVGTGGSTDNNVFGYQERFAEYRYKPSRISGLMRSYPTTGTSLDIWHLSQAFGALPTLGDGFIKETPPVSRVIAVDTEPAFLFDAYFDLKCARPMPTFSVPGLIDHF